MKLLIIRMIKLKRFTYFIHFSKMKRHFSRHSNLNQNFFSSFPSRLIKLQFSHQSKLNQIVFPFILSFSYQELIRLAVLINFRIDEFDFCSNLSIGSNHYHLLWLSEHGGFSRPEDGGINNSFETFAPMDGATQPSYLRATAGPGITYHHK